MRAFLFCPLLATLLALAPPSPAEDRPCFRGPTHRDRSALENRDTGARMVIAETCQASMAVSGGRLYIRTDQHLFCIGFR
jgi:hypothetical protein